MSSGYDELRGITFTARRCAIRYFIWVATFLMHFDIFLCILIFFLCILIDCWCILSHFHSFLIHFWCIFDYFFWYFPIFFHIFSIFLIKIEVLREQLISLDPLLIKNMKKYASSLIIKFCVHIRLTDADLLTNFYEIWRCFNFSCNTLNKIKSHDFEWK